MKTFLLTGRSGMGKSSFINTTFGIRVPTDDFEACTRVVEMYGRDTPFGEVRLFDSPGLAEKDGRHDQLYLGMIQEAIKGVHLDAMIYVTRLDETRFRPEEKTTLERLTAHLGSRTWERSWLVLTHAASVPKERFDAQLEHRMRDIRGCLVEATSAPGCGPRFGNFRKILVVDNVVFNWSEDCRPLLTFFR